MKEEVRELLELKEAEELNWEEMMEHYSMSEVRARCVKFYDIPINPETWLELFKDLSDEEIAEIILAVEEDDYEAYYIEDDNPRRDSLEISVKGKVLVI